MTHTTDSTRTVSAAYIQRPFQVSFREVPLRLPQPGEVLIDVLACGVCGYDLEIAESLAEQPQAFGHEIAGLVREVGDGVSGVAVGDQVVLESSSFCGECATCRNGRVDLCSRGAGFWQEPAMGFAASMVVPARAVVPAAEIDPCAAVLAEPCGVAIDMVKTAEIGMTDRVLVVGTGPIGLMALALVRRRTTGPVVAINRSPARLAIATRLGADAVFTTEETPLAACGQPYGGFDKVLITAPPRVIPDCISAAAYGGYLVFIGSDFVGGGVIPLDTHALHFGKKQLRSSFASPALYLPEALQLLRTGIVPAHEIVSHRFPLSRIADALQVAKYDRATACKVLVIPDMRFA